MEKFFLAIGLVLALEGALYALFPSYLRGILRKLDTISDSQMRLGGLVALSLGVILVWFVSSGV